MKVSRQSVACALLNIFLLVGAASFAAGQDKPGNPASDWLNGKWDGQPPAGQELQMTLRVEKDNQVRGTGLIPEGGRKAAHPQVTGTVNGDQVTLETFFPSAFPRSIVHYDCTLIEGTLKCKTKSGYETTFRKVK
jgi:hypothetical protein